MDSNSPMSWLDTRKPLAVRFQRRSCRSAQPWRSYSSSFCSMGSKFMKNSRRYSHSSMPRVVRRRSIKYSPPRSRWGIRSDSSMTVPPSSTAAI
ncbi:Uncharacterised protein [Flavonifractor plautii]|uniref:Uncharacterized protein n=1 Tax=Flavonifractor plautii TaxID=292800 RepID=A0A174PZ57_FLAPL|nr:Uncharacterised protein [Flavonifractor plautii]